MEEQTNWRIWVAGYGDYDFTGTETQAHAERRRKADSEGTSVSLMWRTDLKPFGSFSSVQTEDVAMLLDDWYQYDADFAFDEDQKENEE
jgi:hypothetical protein